MPPDVLGHIILCVDKQDVISMLHTCMQWHYSIKSQLETLQPLYLGNPVAMADTPTVKNWFSGL